jgi:hypothetical protein
VLLRRTFRHAGKVGRETLANLSRLPGQVIALVDAALKGATLVDAQDAFGVERSVPHGNAAAAHVMASKLGLASLLGPPCAERDIACALILSRAVRPESKLPTVGWWQSGDTNPGADLGVADAGTDDVYAAMDWLAGRQREIEKQLAGRHLREGGIAMSGLSSSRGGTEPDLLDEVAWWQTDDFWQYALYAAVAYIRAAASRAGVPVRRVCQELAQRDGPRPG